MQRADKPKNTSYRLQENGSPNRAIKRAKRQNNTPQPQSLNPSQGILQKIYAKTLPVRGSKWRYLLREKFGLGAKKRSDLGWNKKECYLAHAKAQLCHTLVGAWHRPEIYTGIVGAFKQPHHRNIYPCKPKTASRHTEPNRTT